MSSQIFSTTYCGFTISESRSKLKQSFLRHSLICDHQASSLALFLSGPEALIMADISTNTSLRSPTIGTSTFTRFEITEGSISMWMIFLGTLQKCAGLPITRSSKRAPIAINTSQCCIVILASYVPCIPNIPKKRGSVPGNPPKPIKVLVTG